LFHSGECIPILERLDLIHVRYNSYVGRCDLDQ